MFVIVMSGFISILSIIMVIVCICEHLSGFFTVFFVIIGIFGIIGFSYNRSIKIASDESKALIPEFGRTYEKYKEEYEALKKEIISESKIYKHVINTNKSVFRTNDDIIVIAEDIAPENYSMSKINAGFESDECAPKRGSITELKKFPVSDVLFWMEKGDVQYTTNISGGGSSVSGAVLGGIIAGDTGAVIGSREGIKTEMVTHDSRHVIIKYTNGREEKLDHDYYIAFMECMPEKEYTFLQMSKQQ